MKVVCLYPRFHDFGSHHFHEAAALLAEYRRRGRGFLPLMSGHAQQPVVRALGGRAVFDDPTFRLELPFAERSRRFVEQLRAHVDPLLEPGDVVMDTVSTQLEAHALVQWLAARPRERRPRVVIGIISDRWNRVGAAERERQVAEFAILRAALDALDAQDRARLTFFTLTPALADEIAALIGVRPLVTVMPMPYAGPDAPRLPRPDATLPRIGVLGGARREKGSYLVPDIVRACARRGARYEFVVQLTNNALTPADEEAFAAVANEPRVLVVERPMTPDEYVAVLNSCDVVLCPYEVVPYRQRTSSVFAEAVALGKPAVVTDGTWKAAQLRAGRAVGTIAAAHDVESFADAIERCVADLPALSRRALELSPAWRAQEGAAVFAEHLESALAD